MKEKNLFNNTNVIDLHKRKSLKGFTCVSAISLLSTMQSLAAEPMFSGKAVVQDGLQRNDIEATLISSPGVVEDTLLLRNLTGQQITVSHFRTNKLVFDGTTVDCNGACANAEIVIPAGAEIAVQVLPLHDSEQRFGTSGRPAEYLDVHTSVSQLPGGTRIVPLVAHMVGKAAVLSRAA